MKVQVLVFCVLWATLASCIREEALNAEADILSCTLPGDVLKTDPEIDNESVTLTVKNEVDITNLAPEFTLTPGATISPASGTAFDFTTDQAYTVTSEDRQWSKTYTVRCIVSGISAEYHFENVTLEPTNERYHIFYDFTEEGDSVTWASANAGFALTNSGLGIYDFPTMQDEDGYVGKCAKLVTRSTGSFGESFGMPLAAGNLFIGTFDVLNAIPDGRKGTRMGRTFPHVPTYLCGYYKYQAGETYEVDGEAVSDETDQFDIYAIFFETDDDVKYLDGVNCLTSSNLISVARISDRKETDEWTRFYIPFEMRAGKVIDKEKLEAGKYYLSVVFTSSIHGDIFEGAVGSTLWVDEVEIIYEED